MTALDHLRSVVRFEPCREEPVGIVHPCCDWIDDHAPDCPWVAAKAFVEQEDAVAKHLDGSNPESWAKFHGPYVSRPGFTLIELLVVIGIILLVSVLTIPSISGAISHRQVGEAARSLSAVLAGARDAAIRDNRPSGIRLMPDPAFNGQQPLTLPNPAGGPPIANPSPFAGRLDPGLPLAYNRIVPISPAPSYSEGFVLQVQPTAGMFATTGPLAAIGDLAYPVPSPAVTAPLVSQTTPLVLVEAVVTQVVGVNGVPTTIPNPPTSWMWNIRLGDKVQINSAGPWYTVVGPMVIGPSGGNPDLFVNVGMPGVPMVTPFTQTQFGQSVTPEFLLLVNGRDDNSNGWIDEGWDGVDNDGNGTVDDIGEWKEAEAWLGSPPSGVQQTYSVARRPVPQLSAREIQLPSDVVIDATSWNTTQERSRLPVNQFTGFVDILVNPDGTAVPTTLYSSPSSISMNGVFYHLWLAERGDIYPPSFTVVNGAPVPSLVAGFPMSLPMPIDTISQASPTAAIDPSTSYAMLLSRNPSLPVLKGEIRILTLFSRAWTVTTIDNPAFNVMNPNQPFFQAQQGAQ